MLELLIIADDYTGALDTGVQFSASGARTCVVTDLSYDFQQNSADAEVIVIDTESRHIASYKAYQIVRGLAERAIAAGVPHIFKKTDSALRGNIGSELTALLDASGETVLPFVPSFPKMNRVSQDGILYIDGEPLENSVFRQDPFEPMKKSFIPDIIAEQSGVRTDVIRTGKRDELDVPEKRIAVYDCSTDRQMAGIAKRLRGRNRLKILAGRAGFASVLPAALDLTLKKTTEVLQADCLFAVCGSVNPITVRQLDYAEENGFRRFRLTAQQKLQEGYWKTKQGEKELAALLDEAVKERVCVVDSNDLPDRRDTVNFAVDHNITDEVLRKLIPASLGEVMKGRMERLPKAALMIMGGDTLMGFFRLMGITMVEPVTELFPGTVLSRFSLNGESYQVVSKSGGFGRETLLADLEKLVVKNKEEEKC